MTFLTDFLKNTQISNLIKIHPVGAELLHVDRWTDMRKLTVAFRTFANVAINEDVWVRLCKRPAVNSGIKL
jgi:hypothetical protein